MDISFNVLGLHFEAEVAYNPGHPGSYFEPEEYPEVEILTLTCQGKDAEFLLQSEWGYTIENAAYERAGQQYQDEQWQLEEDRAADIAFDLEHGL